MANLNKLFKFLFSKKSLITFIILIFIIGSGVAVYYFTQEMDLGIESDDPNVEAEMVVEKVGSMYLLPDEIPTLATVSDKSQLVDQVFFKKSENGDKVLIYRTAGIAILYRPSLEKIINVGPVTLDEGEIEGNTVLPVTNMEELENVDVLILNGTTTVGITQGAASRVSGLKFVTILDRDDAINKPYATSVVIYKGEEARIQAEVIAASFSASITGNLPDGEAITGADIVVILGEDFASQ